MVIYYPNAVETHIIWYGHLVITASLFWPKEKLSQSYVYLKNPLYGYPLHTARCLWRIGDRINQVPLYIS